MYRWCMYDVQGDITLENKQFVVKNIARVSISIDTAYSEKIDALIKAKVFKSRAEVVRAALRELFEKYSDILGNVSSRQNAESPRSIYGD